MRKELLLICFVLPIIAVNAQTFERKPQQPAFFMPKSAISVQQPERLPAVKDMNYQGQHVPNSVSSPFITPSENEDVSKEDISPTTPAENLVATEEKPDVKIDAIKEKEQAALPEPEPKAPKIKEIPQKIEITDNTDISDKGENSSENYQEIFARILNNHRQDLDKISRGQPLKNPELDELIESYRPQIRKINDTVDVRSAKL